MFLLQAKAVAEGQVFRSARQRVECTFSGVVPQLQMFHAPKTSHISAEALMLQHSRESRGTLCEPKV